MEINFISWLMFFIKVVNVYLVDIVQKLVNIGFEVMEILLINWLMLVIKLMIIDYNIVNIGYQVIVINIIIWLLFVISRIMLGSLYVGLYW